jgi:carbonic anhydrase
MCYKTEPVIRTLANESPKISTPGSLVTIEELDLKSVIDHLMGSPLRQYKGSLTTPPCKEGPTFLIAEEPLNIGPSPFKALKKVMKFNSRYTQNKIGKTNLLQLAAAKGVQWEHGLLEPQLEECG